ncbi:hypothetical protein N24_2509 [Corynebacterium suranareeae]|uniref:Uncharacterized protein n=1 Tax=Corynebacterium suranareeae TaxID=2506452 RepID=A0A160PUH5_9CORY|nr:hypothetical protein [Corynebacterium suranareeae]BAU96771.1 hypothetical protein N24_2509 [Corynebacterium suranareeae]
MSRKNPNPKSVMLRSRDNKTVEIRDARDRAFIKQADDLIVKIDKLLDIKNARLKHKLR